MNMEDSFLGIYGALDIGLEVSLLIVFYYFLIVQF